MRRDRNLLEQTQQQECTSAPEKRVDQSLSRENLGNRRTRGSTQMDSIILRTIQSGDL